MQAKAPAGIRISGDRRSPCALRQLGNSCACPDRCSENQHAPPAIAIRQRAKVGGICRELVKCHAQLASARLGSRCRTGGSFDPRERSRQNLRDRMPERPARSTPTSRKRPAPIVEGEKIVLAGQREQPGDKNIAGGRVDPLEGLHGFDRLHRGEGVLRGPGD